MTRTGTQAPTAHEPPLVALPDGRTIVDRRRPGRVAYANPALIALLRRTVRAQTDAAAGPADDLAAARGIALGAVIGAVLYVMALGVFRAIWPA